MESQKQFHNWIIKEPLGSGTYGNVFRCLNTKTNKSAAIKIVNEESSALNETTIIKKLQGNKSIIQFFECGYELYGYCLVFELHIMNLNQLRLNQPTLRFSVQTSFRLLYKMIKILEYIHSKQILHCDIKPDNFMISQDGDIILIDFGLSEHYQDFSFHQKLGFKGSLKFASPNQHLGKKSIPIDDIIPLFYIFYQNITGILPWDTISNPHEIYQLKIKFKSFSLFSHSLIPLSLALLFESSICNSKSVNYQLILDTLSKLFNSQSIPLSPLFEPSEYDEKKFPSLKDDNYKKDTILENNIDKQEQYYSSQVTSQELSQDFFTNIKSTVSKINPFSFIMSRTK
ncbi:protein kinase domain containing protein [Entamoeba nuttalli P19]|uniref:non-specific serine/threonine protein kinase n=1 Tax=Entamoeba nuttalli (strain P19) TaxID=1076696 RepID=K2GFG9_ENTNP|nr:protein kinase domain containing protein [Entamoeba nuttalli P19]EKE41431.1 protein kinase domain containing protein [Entamoeba nuttalli P19]|eukprot:XP_008856235.1 protein kinase domain containing protein [Entamoeba nuttalli P19]